MPVEIKWKTVKEMVEDGFAIYALGHREMANKLQQEINAMDSRERSHYLVEVYDDYMVYEVEPKFDENGAVIGSLKEAKLYKQPYTVNGEKVQLDGLPVEVQRKVEFISVNEEGGSEDMSKKTEPCCPEKVELLIQSEHTRFEEEDREWLSTLTKDQIEKMMVEEPKEEKPTVHAGGGGGGNGNGTGGKEMTKEDAMKVLREEIKTPEGFLSLLPGEIKEHVEYGLKMHNSRRTELISGIVAHSDYTEEELKIKATSELEKIAKLALKEDSPQAMSWMGFGAGGGSPLTQAGNGAHKEEPMPPTGITFEDEQKGAAK